MDISFEEKKKLYKVRNIIIEMLNDRGYKYSDHIDFNEFLILLEADNINININDEIYVYFYNENKNFGKNEFKNIVSNIQKSYHQDIKILIILRENENSAVRNEMNKIQNKNIEIFLQKNLTFNITKHELVPKHVLLNENEIQEVIDKYNTPKNMFPKMNSDDPVAKYYGAKSGDMFKIYRKSHSVGKTIAYRMIK